VNLTDLPAVAVPGTATALIDAAQVDDMADASRRYLAGVERDQWDAIRNPKRRLQWLAARICVKLLAEREGLVEDACHCLVSKNRFGQPSLLDSGGRSISEAGTCSLSHKGPFACACLATTASLCVGVDIEEIAIRLLRISGAFANPHDSSGLGASIETDLAIRWTLKEAYSKSIGVGMRVGFENLICEQDPETKTIGVRTKNGPRAHARYLVYQGYAIGACFTHRAHVPSYQRIGKARESTAGYIR